MKLKNLFVTFLCFISFMCLSANALEGQTTDALQQPAQSTLSETAAVQEVEEPNITTKPVTAEIDRASAKSPYENDIKTNVADHSKNELARMIFMFVKVMFAVAVSSVIIYLLLLLIKNFYGTQAQPTKMKFEDNLKSTQNENEALKIFLNKTKSL